MSYEGSTDKLMDLVRLKVCHLYFCQVNQLISVISPAHISVMLDKLDNASSLPGLYVEKNSKQNNENSWKFTLLDNIVAFIWSSGEN